jgi:hypothetical protein
MWTERGHMNPVPYLLKGHILMAERFAGCFHVLQSKICILLQDMSTSISLREHTEDSYFIYLFMVYEFLWFAYSHKSISRKRMQKLCQLWGL